MKKTNFLLISTIILFSISINTAQSKNVILSPAWEDFSVNLPGEPEVFASNLKNVERGRLYRLIENDRYFFIDSNEDIASSEYGSIVNYLDKNLIKKVSIQKGNDYKNEYIKFLDSEGFYQTIYTVQRPNRFYTFHTISLEENDLAVTKFFESIKFERSVFKPSKKPDKNHFVKFRISAATENTKFKNPGEIYVEPELSKYLDHQKDATGPTTRLKVLSKKKPAYTELARSYNLTGEVKLKVVFLRNGKIGTISAINKLPLGLTNSAIEACRQIRFKAPQHKGVPYHIAKTVVYKFTIY